MGSRLAYYAVYAWRSVFLRRPGPLIFGIGITDRCNLSCAGCRVSNTGRPDLPWLRLQDMMRDAYQRGFRELYFTGGEPMLWRDHGRTIEDAIRAARLQGFFHIHLYTNGTCGLATSADLTWVSVDGLPDIYRTRRGDHFGQVEHALRSDAHGDVAVIYVIDRSTARGIEDFLLWVRDTALPVLGVMFYFHTPYYGKDELYLSAEERSPIIDRLISCIAEALPVLNSRAGLLALKCGKWPRRLPVAVIADVDGESVCCRAADEVCADCGYGACTEIVESLRLRPTALMAMGRYL
jgi:Fe-coproporphyrin III synthase